MFCYRNFSPVRRKDGQKFHKPNINIVAETLYIIVTILYVLKVSSNTTLFYIPWPTWYEKALRMFLCIIIFLKVGNKQGYSRGKWGICILSFVIFKASWRSTQYEFLLDTALLAVAAVGTSYRKILKAGFWTGLYTLLIAMLGSFMGCIEDLVYFTGEHSFGIVYPTDFAAHIMYLSLIGWVLYKKSTVVSTVLTAGLTFFVYYYCGARCSTIVLILQICCILYLFFEEKYEKKSSVIRGMIKLINKSWMYIMPLCACFIITLTLLYNAENTGISRIDTLLSNRLRLGWMATKSHGISLFGTVFSQTGSGGSTIAPLNYNFIDSSYVLVMLRYGLLSLAIILAKFVYLGKRAIKNNQRRLVLAIVLVSIHSMIEHHLLEVAYNLFLLLPFADLSLNQEDSPQTSYKLNPWRAACSAGICIIVFCFLPRLVGYLKTIVELLEWNIAANHIRFIGLISVLLLIGCLIIKVFCRMIAICIQQKVLSGKHLIAFVTLTFSLLFLFIKGEQIIRVEQLKYADFIEEDRPILETLLSSKEKSIGKIFVDRIPEIYKREFQYISDGIFAPEGAVTRANTTLIVNDTTELRPLLESGYQYGQFTPERAVYTNSTGAQKTLEQAGITFTTYYNKQRNIDLQAMAIQNGIELTDTGALLLDGPQKSLNHGSGETIYSGLLRVEYSLHLAEDSNKEGNIAIARIYSDWGQRILYQTSIAASNFDQNGNCVYTIDIDLKFNYSGIEFLLSVPENVRLEVQQICYGKIK